MVHFIYGRTGTGKSRKIFSLAERAAVNGRRVYILVPDRDAVIAERRASTLSGAGNIDVVTFRRLSNYVFRALGGLCENYIGAGAKKVIMHSVLGEIAPRLGNYKNISKTDLLMTERLVKARGEMMRNDITPEALADAAARLGEKTAAKLSDLSLVFSEFDRAVGEKWKDPDGMLSAVCELAGAVDFFRGCNVYVDSFSAFTSQQYGFLEIIAAGAENVVFSVAYDPDRDKNVPAFMTLANTDERIRKAAARAGAIIGGVETMRVASRYESKDLEFLSQNIFSTAHPDPRQYEGKTENISVIRAENPYAEAEAIAVDVCRRIHGGARLSDIAVITRSTDEYKGIIDAVFDKYEIPYFISEKTDIAETSLIKLVTGALNVAKRGFYADDVIAYIKTDLCGVDEKDAFAFENYVIKWSVSGNRFTDGDFVENPRGFVDGFTDDDRVRLDAINLTRKAVIEPLKNFSTALENKKTVRGQAEVLFDFLSSLGVPERLDETARRAHDRGDLALESTEKKLWRAFCDALDLLVTSVGDKKCDIDDFSVYLSAILSETDIGRIPTAIDRVLIADAVLTSVTGVKYVYAIGCYSGGFPHRVGEDGIFTENEKSELESVGVEISSRLWKKLSDELFYFYTAVSAPSVSLTVTYPCTGPDGEMAEKSQGVLRILELFPDIKEIDFKNTPIQDLIWTKRASLEYVARGGALGDALKEYYKNDPEYAALLEIASTPMSSESCALDAQTARELFGDTLSMSPSRLESYVKCRFAYFCDKELNLSDDRRQSFGEIDVGIFLHKIMEISVKYAAKHPDATDDEIDRIISSAAKTELDAMLRGVPSKKLMHIIDFLKDAARVFVKDYRDEKKHSKFEPYDVEITIGSGGVEPVTLSDGRLSVKIHGRIDRVDTYKGDGKTYIIVYDYKTGEKTFKPDNVKIGLDMQLLLYLFSICENGEKLFGSPVAPAGAVYVGIRPPSLTLTLEEDPTLKTQKTDGGELDKKKNVVRMEKSGLFLADVEVLRAMDDGLNGEFIPVTLEDVSKYDEEKPGKLISNEKLETLKKEVFDTVMKIAGELCGGKAGAVPISTGSDSPCSYCRFRAVCRAATAKRGDEDEEN